MAARDKNGETASERIARKFIAGHKVRECNTKAYDTVEQCVLKRDLVLYSSKIATLHSDKLFIYDNHQFSGSRLTNERKHALRLEAQRNNITVIEVTS